MNNQTDRNDNNGNRKQKSLEARLNIIEGWQKAITAPMTGRP